MDQLVAVAASTAEPIARAALRDLSWSGNGWVADVRAEILHADGSPIRLIPTGAGWTVDPRFLPPDLDAGPYLTHQVRGGNVDVTLRNRMNDVEWYLAADVEPKLAPIDDDPDGASKIVFRGSVQVDPTTAGGGRPLGPGGWDLVLRLDAFGISRMALPKFRSGVAPVLSPRAIILPVRRIVTPRLLAKGKKNLVFNVVKVLRPWREKLVAALRQPRDVMVTPGGDLVATLTLAIPKLGAPTDCRVVLIGGGAAAQQKSADLKPAAIGVMLANRMAGGQDTATRSASDRASGDLRRIKRGLGRKARGLSRRLGVSRTPKKR
jgi:hypothetical protein